MSKMYEEQKLMQILKTGSNIRYDFGWAFLRFSKIVCYTIFEVPTNQAIRITYIEFKFQFSTWQDKYTFVIVLKKNVFPTCSHLSGKINYSVHLFKNTN